MTQAADHLYRQAGAQFAPALARLARSVERDADKARDLEQEMHCALWSSLARLMDELMGRNPEHRFNFIQNRAGEIDRDLIDA